MLSNQEIGKRIFDSRKLRSMTLEDVAQKTGVDRSTIMRYEKGTIAKIKLPVLEAIARALDVNPSWLIGKSERMLIDVQKRVAMTEKQRELIAAVQSLSDEDAELLLSVAENLQARHKSAGSPE